MKKRIKSSQCLNCGKPLLPEDNFCASCGQENDNKRQSFGKIMIDLFENFLSLDSKFANSIPAILFKPGYLTKEYLSGKRQKYLAPARMFITIVVVYFIINSFGEDKIVINNQADSETSQQLSDAQVLVQEGPFNFRITNKDGNTTIATDPSDILNNDELNDSRFGHIRSLVKQGITDTDQVLDSIQVEKTFLNRFYYSQSIKLARTEYENLKSYFYSKLPWIIFLLMPVFALLLKLLYIRKKVLYIDHLIFAFHLHTFYFILGVLLLLASFVSLNNLEAIVSVAGLIYTVIAFMKFYNQGIIKTFLKIILLWITYFISALVSVLFILLVMFIFY